MKLKTINNPSEFFDDLEKLFQEKVFVQFSDKYLDNNLDDDIFATLFIIYFIMYIYFPNENGIKLLQSFLKQKQIIPFISLINKIKTSKKLILN